MTGALFNTIQTGHQVLVCDHSMSVFLNICAQCDLYTL